MNSNQFIHTIFSTCRVEGKTLFDKVWNMHSTTEDDIAQIIRQLCEYLDDWHKHNFIHLDLRVRKEKRVLFEITLTAVVKLLACIRTQSEETAAICIQTDNITLTQQSSG